MRKTKYVFPAFSFYDRTGIQRFLEKKARQGWLLENMGSFAWKFRRIEPKQIHFAVTYFPKASAFEPEPSEQQEVFREFCAHSGWILAAASAQLQVFYNETENPVPIETDPGIELENIHKVAKKTYLLNYFLMIPLGLIQLGNIVQAWKYFPLDVLSNNLNYFNVLCAVILLLMCGAELLGYFGWYFKAKKAAAEGQFVATKGKRTFQIVLLCILMIALLVLLVSFTDAKQAVMLVLLLVLISGVCAICIGATKLMKKQKYSARKNQTVTFLLIIVLSFAATGLGTVGVVSAMGNWLSEEENVVTYEFRGEPHKLYRDDIPLRIQDLMEVDPEIYSYACSSDRESPVLRQYVAYQRPRYDMLDQPSLDYTIVEVKADFLYEFCLNTMLEGRYGSYTVDIEGNITRDTYFKIDEPAWGADAVYQLRNGQSELTQYLVCYGDLILELNPDWEMTDAQKASVGGIFD